LDSWTNASGSPQLLPLIGNGGTQSARRHHRQESQLKKMVGFGIVNTQRRQPGKSNSLSPGCERGAVLVSLRISARTPDRFTVRAVTVTRSLP